MNDWVYAGFDETYKMMGVTFDKIYYESNTYLEGKEKVMEGLEKGFFYKKEDGSVYLGKYIVAFDATNKSNYNCGQNYYKFRSFSKKNLHIFYST